MVESADGGVSEVLEELLKREPWRNQDAQHRNEYEDWVFASVHARSEHGAAKYPGNTFRGIPTEQGIEECLDQLFYLFWARKHIAFIEGQRNLFRGLLEELVEWSDYSRIDKLRSRVFMALRDSS
jgi:hypothetical protein